MARRKFNDQAVRQTKTLQALRESWSQLLRLEKVGGKSLGISRLLFSETSITYPLGPPDVSLPPNIAFMCAAASSQTQKVSAATNSRA
jgi:hypothetical protein